MTDINSVIKRYNCVCGYFGVGKTNFALNLAIKCAEKGKTVTIVDLDTVNQFFRSSVYVDELNKMNIKVISPCQFSAIESPALSAEIYSCFDSEGENEIFIFDLGGDSVGARVMGMFAEKITEKNDYNCFYVVNKNRIQVDTVEKCIEKLSEIEFSSHIKATSIVNNTHLLDKTDESTVLSSAAFVNEVCEKTGLPLSFTCVPEEMMQNKKIENRFDVKRFSTIL